MEIDQELRQQLLCYQRNEITEHHIYTRLAATVKSVENRRILEGIAADELRHYEVWKTYTQQDVNPNRFEVWKYYWLGRIFGLTFSIKLMETGEEGAQESYGRLHGKITEAQEIVQDEHEHEESLIDLLDEERLRYIGSIVLGLNDALVELTGALAGLTLALQSTRLVALTGSITGIAAALSMGASEYLSTKTEGGDRNPIKAAVYTTSAYVVTVTVLILPYLILGSYYVALACTLVAAIAIITFFNYYITVAQSVPFKTRFFEMTGLSLGVATLSFFIGFAIRAFLGVDI